MKTRHIGNDSVGRVEVGAVGLGLMTFDQSGTQPREQLLATVRTALDAASPSSTPPTPTASATTDPTPRARTRP